MIRVSFTKFLDFIAQTGEPKATTALQAWRQGNTPYDPRFDYHKRIRSQIIDREKTDIEPNWKISLRNKTRRSRPTLERQLSYMKSGEIDIQRFHGFRPREANGGPANSKSL